MEINEKTEFAPSQTDIRGFKNRKVAGQDAADRTAQEGGQYIRSGDWIYPDSGGIYTPIMGALHPFPGKIDYYIAARNNAIKSMSIGYLKTFAALFKLWKGWRPPLMEFLTGWTRLVNWTVWEDFLELDRYQPFCKELILIIYCFLKGIGFPAELSYSVAESAVVMIEHDDQYRNRPLDLMGEFNRNAFLKHPGREIDRLFKIYLQREKIKGEFLNKAKAIRFLLKFVLLWPKGRRSLLAAVRESDTDRMSPKIVDAYWAMDNSTYDFGGYSLEQRATLWFNIHEGKLPPKVTFRIKPDEN